MLWRHLWPRQLPSGISDCGDILWLDVELHLWSGGVFFVCLFALLCFVLFLSCVVKSFLFCFLSLLLSFLLFCSFFLSSCRLSFVAGEADSFAPWGSTFSGLVTCGLKSQETGALGGNPHQVRARFFFACKWPQEVLVRSELVPDTADA